jgi:hypothetical protein
VQFLHCLGLFLFSFTQGVIVVTNTLSSPRDLGGNLRLRWSTSADLEALLDCYGFVYRDTPESPVTAVQQNWIRSLIVGGHPQANPNNFAVVEDLSTKKIVAATTLMQQNIDFGGIPLSMGRPEIVATMPEYRNRGLIRHIFALIHERSEQRGDHLQGITGIPYYYRQFGYEYALSLQDYMTFPFEQVPSLAEGTSEPYRLRKVMPNETSILIELYEQNRTRPRSMHNGTAQMKPLVTTPATEEYWQWSVNGHPQPVAEGWTAWFIVDTDEQICGYVLQKPLRWGKSIRVWDLGVAQGVSYLQIWPSLLRALKQIGEQEPGVNEKVEPATQITFEFVGPHPLHDVVADAQGSNRKPGYYWYIRVADTPRFIRTIAPVLEQRLAESPLANYSGELSINHYRNGLKIGFEQGKLTVAEPWILPTWGAKPNVGIPAMPFLHLLFGNKNYDTLKEFFPDVWAHDEAAQVLRTIFPAQASVLLPLD